jgi:hypothetical protein
MEFDTLLAVPSDGESLSRLEYVVPLATGIKVRAQRCIYVQTHSLRHIPVDRRMEVGQKSRAVVHTPFEARRILYCTVRSYRASIDVS